MAFDTLQHLIVLLLVVYRNMRSGRLWLGDAFVGTSSRVQVYGFLVIGSWHINEYWALREFCFHDGNAISEVQVVEVLPAIMEADLMAVFLAFAGALGIVCRERIDPFLAIILFQIGFHSRKSILEAYPSLVALVNESTQALYELHIRSRSVERSSPMHYWGIHPMPPRNNVFILTMLFPIFSMFGGLIVYVILRKSYRLYLSRLSKRSTIEAHKMRSIAEEDDTANSVSNDSAPAGAIKSPSQNILTQFETATGVVLQNRYGLIADYENYMFIKGLRYASADGIYGNGMVIVNGRFLVQNDDLWTIVIMKIIRTRFRNVYIYAVQGNTVQQTALLVYPHTITWKELVKLDLSILL